MVDAQARLEELDRLFAALAHTARRTILLTIVFRGGEMTSGDIADRFHCSWPTISRHLRVLESADLITHARVGRERLYRVNKRSLELVHDFLKWFDVRGKPGRGARSPVGRK